MFEEKYLSTAGVATLLGCSRRWVRLLLQRGELRCTETPIGRLVPRETLDEDARTRLTRRGIR
jgi:excisionase family DNA binding protein